jgi:hypothetical protein
MTRRLKSLPHLGTERACDFVVCLIPGPAGRPPGDQTMRTEALYRNKMNTRNWAM